MSPADISLFIFAFYVALVGIGYFFFPKTILKLLKDNTVDFSWIQILGSLVMALAFYYFYVSLNGISAFYMATVIARYSVFVLWIGLALAKKNYQLILFALVDAAGATWTLVTIV